jgi:hypothetical protein
MARKRARGFGWEGMALKREGAEDESAPLCVSNKAASFE